MMVRKNKSGNNRNSKSSMQNTPIFTQSSEEHLDISTLETWLWDAACVIRGATDAPKFKDFILPLVFYKRLSDVFDDEFANHVVEFGGEGIAHEIVEADHIVNDRAAVSSGAHRRSENEEKEKLTLIEDLP